MTKEETPKAEKPTKDAKGPPSPKEATAAKDGERKPPEKFGEKFGGKFGEKFGGKSGGKFERKFGRDGEESRGGKYSRKPTPEQPYQPSKPVVEDVGPPPDIPGPVYKTGKRKNAIARVWIKPGKGEIVVNKKPMKEYFTRYSLQKTVVQPFVLLDWRDKFDIRATTRGGGISGQAQALRFGISRALAEYGEKPRAALRKNGNLTRDSRVVERKKYGLHKARRAHQFSKR